MSHPVVIESLPVGKKRSDLSVKLDAEAYRQAKTVAAWKGVSLNEYLKQAVLAATRADLAKMRRELEKQQGHGPVED